MISGLNKKKILNSRGAVVMSVLIIITVMIVIMTGVASMQVLEIARQSARMTEAYQMLNVVEDMGQLVARAVMLGREVDNSGGSCPSGTTSYDYDSSGTTHTACLPGSLSTPPTDVCIVSKDSKGFASTFCLRSLSLGAAFTASNTDPLVTTAVASPSNTTLNEGVTPTASINASHTSEPWFPADTAWGFSNVTYLVDCTVANTPADSTALAFGCMRNAYSGVASVEFTMCKPNKGAAVTTCTTYYTQRLGVYYPYN